MSAKTIPVLFSGPLVRAILDGRKTATRRPMKPQPEPSTTHPRATVDLAQRLTTRGPNWYPVTTTPPGRVTYGIGHSGWNSPLGQPGDFLYVREAWAPTAQVWSDALNGYASVALSGSIAGMGPSSGVVYRASEGELFEPWRPSIHMPRWASRIVLRVTDLRVERLQEITEDGAKAEGVPTMKEDHVPLYTYRRGFESVWDAIYGERSHDDAASVGPLSYGANPWVWVCEFEVVATERREAQRVLASAATP